MDVTRKNQLLRKRKNETPPVSFKILVADDDPVSRTLLGSILESNGFEVFVAGSGKDCLIEAQKHIPDLILLDIVFPDINGFEICKRLKDSKRLERIPIIFVTGVGDGHNVVHGLNVGGSDYVVKPFLPEEVLARVKIHLNLQVALKQSEQSQRDKLARLRRAHRKITTDLYVDPGARAKIYFEPTEEAGGDQFDVVRLSTDIYGYFVADVSGHGVEAGFISAALKASFRQNASLLVVPQETLRNVDDVMQGFLSEGQHVTAVYAQLNRRTHSLTVASAGHVPVVLERQNGGIESLEVPGDVIGAFDNPIFKQKYFKVETGDRLWLLTDGVVENLSAREPRKTGLDRFAAALIATHTGDLSASLDRLSVMLFDTHPGFDDRLILAVEV